MKRLPNNFKAGDPISGLSADWFATITNFYNELEMMYGEVIRSSDGRTILNPFMAPGVGTGGGESFALSSITGVFFTITGGNICYSGRASITVPDGATVEITGGTYDAPCFVSLRVPANIDTWGDGAWIEEDMLVCTETYPVDGGGYFFKCLHEVYLVNGSARWKRSRRGDWMLRSPI